MVVRLHYLSSSLFRLIQNTKHMHYCHCFICILASPFLLFIFFAKNTFRWRFKCLHNSFYLNLFYVWVFINFFLGVKSAPKTWKLSRRRCEMSFAKSPPPWPFYLYLIVFVSTSAVFGISAYLLFDFSPFYL